MFYFFIFIAVAFHIVRTTLETCGTFTFNSVVFIVDYPNLFIFTR